MFSIADALKNVTQTIKKAEIDSGRESGSVQLLAVSKKQPAERLIEAFEQGQKAFGENYVSEALAKQADVRALLGQRSDELEWHFIGPVQSNKTRSIAESFDWVQGLDREKIARRLNEQRPSELGALQVCIQVNIDLEETKSGVEPEHCLSLAKTIDELEQLNLRGLMCIPSAQQDAEVLKDSFSRMRVLFESLKQMYPQVDTLSMGMSADMAQAITSGSTMVRVGTALFGKRPDPQR